MVSSKGVEIFLDNPLENEVVQSPLMIKGMAPGNWFFEASAPVVLTNWDGLIIGESYITAKGDWMTTEYVPFEGTLEFTNTEYGNYGFLILKKDNPSGEAEFDDAIEFKVLFK
ncbi:MAG: Gmad2 immunoglobulin-like domain-containing protein [Candidatus Paceibacterota bacterium]